METRPYFESSPRATYTAGGITYQVHVYGVFSRGRLFTSPIRKTLMPGPKYNEMDSVDDEHQ